jgi:hypothetical protein
MGSWVTKWGDFRNVVDVGGDVTGGCVATRTGGVMRVMQHKLLFIM